MPVAQPVPGYAKKPYQAVGGSGGEGGDDRAYLIEALFGARDERGSFLDIGCNLGRFCLEASRRGWAATGIDTDPDVIDAARKLAAGQEPLPAYVCGDFERSEFGETRFDVVACLNVLHHMFDPIHAVKRMQMLARRRVVLEVAQPSWLDRGLLLRSPLVLLARFMPVIWLDHPRKASRAGSRTFLFTAGALRAIFNQHSMAFEPLRVLPSPFKGRLVVEARRRDIGHILVVTGPTSSGKSTFQARFLADGNFRKRFVADEGEWEPVVGRHRPDLPGGRLERVILHYDMLRPLRGSLKTYERDTLLDLMRVAERVTVVTIAADRARLVRQIEESELKGPKWRWARYHMKLRDAYSSPGFLERWYRTWLDFCAECRNLTRLVLVENSGDFVERRMEALPLIIEGSRAGAADRSSARGKS